MHHYNFRLCSKLSARAKTKTIFSEMDIDFAKDSFIMPSQPMLSSPLKRKSAVVDRQELPSSEYFPQLCNNRKKLVHQRKNIHLNSQKPIQIHQLLQERELLKVPMKSIIFKFYLVRLLFW